MSTYLAVILVCFLMKHLVADYFLQGEYMLGKFKPGWDFFLPLLAHVAVHAAFTFTLCGIFGAGVGKAAGLAVFDATVHFFMDRIKAGPKYMGRWKPLTAREWLNAKEETNPLTPLLTSADEMAYHQAQKRLRGNVLFWQALGFDQYVHHLTDLAVVYLLVNP